MNYGDFDIYRILKINKNLQTIDYQWHIRGWLRCMNLDGNGNPTPNATQGDLFSYKLDYETAGYWDGNIGKQSWKRSQDNQLQLYTFSYDGASRLKSASCGEDFSLSNISYNRNSNIIK